MDENNGINEIKLGQEVAVLNYKVDTVLTKIDKLEPLFENIIILNNTITNIDKHVNEVETKLDKRVDKIELRLETFESRDRVSKLTLIGWITGIIVLTIITTLVTYNMYKIGITKEGDKEEKKGR